MVSINQNIGAGGVESLPEGLLEALRAIAHPVFDRPERFTPESAWHEHIPFAYWLVAALGPSSVVELGTHTGDSYSAFCQALMHVGPSGARAWAVDTWLGDDHAGHYGEDVFEDLSAYHERHFGSFSTLLRMPFDQALGSFEEGSIDLLHIDGFHTYDAVKHDLQAWLPKLSSRGVVLLHDTVEQQPDFGVWRLWREMSAEYPAFNFRHGHGLGVLGVGADLPAAVDAMLHLGQTAAARWEGLFAQLGRSTTLEGSLLSRDIADFLEAAQAGTLTTGQEAEVTRGDGERRV